jgi:quercetin dioxygenase-like cupin family protein
MEQTCGLPEKSPYLSELKSILQDMIVSDEGDHVEYVGGAEAAGLYKNKNVAVMLFCMKKGEKMPFHNHDAKEWIITIKGEWETVVDGVKHHIGPRQEIVFEPGSEHGGIALEDLWCVCITIPSDEGYPNAK